MDTLVDRAEVAGEEPVFFSTELDEAAGEFIEAGVLLERESRAAEVAQTKIDVELEGALIFGRGAGC